MVRDGYRVTVKNKFHPMVIVAAAACVICLLLAACGMSTEEQWQEQYDLGQQYLLDGDYEQAIVAFTAAIGIDPNVVDAYLGRAEAYLGGDIESASSENLNLALADYDTAIELDDTLTEAFVSRGEVHVALGTTEDLEEAISDYTSAITLDNTNAEVYVSRGNTYAAKSTGSDDDLMAAVADYDSAIAIDDSLTELYLAEAALYVEMGDYTGAVEAYTNAIEAGLGDSEVYLSRAEAYYELAMTEMDAAASGEEAESLSDSAAGHFNDALADYLTVLELGEDSEDIYLRISEIYILLEDYDSAQAILEQGLLFHPDSDTLTRQLEEITQRMEELTELEELRDYIREEIADDVIAAVAQIEEAIESFKNSEITSLYVLNENPLPDDFDDFTGMLEDTLTVELENGNWIAVYPNGCIYYGEMDNGLSSGYGIRFIVDRSTTGIGYVYALSGYIGEWSDGAANGQGNYFSPSYGIIYEIGFVDGKAEGNGIVYAYFDHQICQCEIEAQDGTLVDLYENDGEKYPFMLTGSFSTIYKRGMPLTQIYTSKY